MATILEIANADRNLHLLIKAIKASGLDEKLRSTGPFTLLAPVDLAFRNIAAPDNFDNLMNVSSGFQKLREILGYHILTVKKMLKDFRQGQKFQTANGKDVTITLKDGSVYVNNAKILAKDMQGSNGVIHSISAVNLPS